MSEEKQELGEVGKDLEGSASELRAADAPWVPLRRLDAKVAKHVMEWPNLIVKDCGGWITVFGNKPDCMTWPRFWELGQATSAAKRENEKHHIPNYSTNIAAAMEVVEKMSSTTKEYWTLEVFSTGAVATFNYEGGRDLPWTVGEHKGAGETLALAICRAAREAVRSRKEETNG